MKPIDLSIPKGAIFSEQRTYRYALWRMWSATKKPLMTIGLNPSTANEITDDPTITRLIGRAAKEGFGGLLMANLYAYVSTDPNALIRGKIETVGVLNDYYLRQMILLSEKQLCAWGTFTGIDKRATEVLKFIAEPYCLGTNRNGSPKHPLYIGYNVPMVRYHSNGDVSTG